MSGCWPNNWKTLSRAPSNARCPSNRERRSPPIAHGRAWPSARQRCPHRLALLTLTSDRLAARGGKRADGLLQGHVGLLAKQLEDPLAGPIQRAVPIQPGATVAAHRARARMAFSPPALSPPAGAADADIRPS